MPSNILPHALKTQILEKLKKKRIVLASASPRRKDILRVIVRTFIPFIVLEISRSKAAYQGIDPEVVPSTFEENLSPDDFNDIHEYPVATATQKAVQVYEKLVVRTMFIVWSTIMKVDV